MDSVEFPPLPETATFRSPFFDQSLAILTGLSGSTIALLPFLIDDRLILSICMILALAGPFAVMTTRTLRPSRLAMTRKGFQIRNLLGAQTYAWKSVSPFRVVTVGKAEHAIRFDGTREGRSGRAETVTIEVDFDMAAADIATLLNRFRARALTEPVYQR